MYLRVGLVCTTGRAFCVIVSLSESVVVQVSSQPAADPDEMRAR